MSNRKILSLTALILTIGCAHWDVWQGRQEQAYRNKPLETMYSEWGAPKSIDPLENGGKFYVFRYLYQGYLCEAKVWTDREGIVRTVQVGGQNGCITGRS